MLSQRAYSRQADYATKCALAHQRYQQLTGKRVDPSWSVKHTWNLINSYNERRHRNEINIGNRTNSSSHAHSAHTAGHKHAPIADSGATDTLIRSADQHILQSVRSHTNGITVGLPNGALISSNAVGSLPIHPAIAPIQAHIFADNVLDRSLVSLSGYTNRGCDVHLTSTGFTITHNGNVVLQGSKAPHDKLWPIDLSTTSRDASSPMLYDKPLVPPEQHWPHDAPLSIDTTLRSPEAHNIVTHQHNADFVAYWHACMGSPAVKTFVQAVSRKYIRVPRLTTKMIHANAPNAMATAQGHLDLARQGVRSTKPPQPTTAPATANDDAEADSDVPAAATEDVYIKTIDLAERYSTDATGRFPVQSLQGGNYVHVAEFNGYIHVEPMVSRSGPDQLKAHRATLEFLRRKGFNPRVHRMDNETSSQLDKYFRDEQIIVEKVAPHNHRTLKAERAIRDFKNHFVSILAGCHTSYLLHQVGTDKTHNHQNPATIE